ncbi:hypothetical protein HNQ08_005457 [Deinococcus humi]|uniref:Uncharacterized protein n=1 Tax=Deinococcus humi TaxID=662880 RepID=A0A7W8NIY3_9DEIO|nr:hypothetical protein [Deinococcus humi]
MEHLAYHLAREARSLGLESTDLEGVSPETVVAFAQRVLSELAALGLIHGREELDCWAVPRKSGH